MFEPYRILENTAKEATPTLQDAAAFGDHRVS